MLTPLLFCTPIQICLKMALLLGVVGRYLVNNTYCANFVVAILVLAVIEGRAERIYADSDVDSAMSISYCGSCRVVQSLIGFRMLSMLCQVH